MTSGDIKIDGSTTASRAAATVRQAQAGMFLEGEERCREYLRVPRMWFGTSSLTQMRLGR
jgi:hypothetical protein